jgi:hypothetical protein
METVGLRTYKLSKSELPLTIEVRAHQLPTNLAIVGHPRVARDGVLLERLIPTVTSDAPTTTLRFQIPLPAQAPAAFDITQSIDCWFLSNSPGDARYVIAIKAANNTEVTTTVRVPTQNPGVANLAFRIA